MDKTILGSQPDLYAERDAIHLAVIPMSAGEILSPGQRVGVVGGKAQPAENLVGIVDPFLENFVDRGQMFWLCLFPNTVTGMRHHWQHPDFDSVQSIATLATKSESEAWLRSFADNNDCPDFETLVAAAAGEKVEAMDGHGEAYSLDFEFLHFNGRDAHGFIPNEFWDHIENYTGKKCQTRPNSFSCGC